MHAHQFEDASAARAFILAGHAIVTLVSKKTGQRFTYKTTRAQAREGQDPKDVPWFVSVLHGPNNSQDYRFIGSILPPRGDRFHAKTIGGNPPTSAPSVQAFEWLWNRSDSFKTGGMPATMEIWHEGRCGRCGRMLTVPESIASGIGPVCAEKAV